jgi:hypothetical protein
MDKQGILSVAQHSLSELMSQPGAILYSSYNTLKPGDVYYLGYNPGGYPPAGPTVGQRLDELPSKTCNDFTDLEWTTAAGQSTLQLRVKWLLDSLGYTVEDVCSSNLIFAQSRDAKGVPERYADVCWPVHEAILALVKPKLILCCGNSQVSSFGYLQRKFDGEIQYSPKGVALHGDWAIKAFRTELNGQPVLVVGFPHLSRYNPIGKPQIIEWIKQL